MIIILFILCVCVGTFSERAISLNAMAASIVRLAFILLPATTAWKISPAPPMSMGMRARRAAMATTQEKLTVQRYVATNRFQVKDNREAAFEKRWADRQSRLGLLDGFRFFCMLRRVARDNDLPYEDDNNYISCTVW